MEEEYQQTVEQLNQLKKIIELDPNNQEILSLYQDLSHLKQLQEVSLIEERKKKLLNLVEEISSSTNSTNTSNNNNDRNVEALTYSTTTSESSSTDIFNKHLLKAENLKEGLKCCIPLENDGHIFFLPGMITEIDDENDNCKVLLITPINENLIPCQKYNCNLNCNLSHGIEINKSLILSYDILDIKTLKEKGICFAKYEDSVWYLAKIIKRVENEDTKHVDKFIIKYKGYDEFEEVSPENIIPVCGMDIENIIDEWTDSENDYSSDSDLISYSSDDDSFKDFDYESISNNSSSNTDETLKFLGDNGSFGEWEKHTKGIASHLMKKMGYEYGKGLGINGEGIVNPIKIEIRPPGKGLDFEIDEIEELTIKRQKEQEKRKLNLIKKKQRKRKINSMESIDSDVFDFLNVSINKKAEGKLYSVETKSKENNNYDENENETYIISTKRKKQEITSKKSKKENNMKLLQIQKQISDLNHQIQRANERYNRNKVRDKVVAEHYKNKIEEFKKILKVLELKERQVKNSIKDSKTMYSKFEF